MNAVAVRAAVFPRSAGLVLGILLCGPTAAGSNAAHPATSWQSRQ